MVDKRDDKLIMAKLEEETKRFNYLKNSLEQFAEIEEEAGKIMFAAHENLRKMNDKDNSTIQKMYNTFQNSSEKMEVYRKDNVKKLNEQIIPAVMYYPEKIREFKRKLNDLENNKKAISKMGEELTRAKTKMEQDKIRDINSKINESNREHLTKDNEFENKIAEFEVQRIDDNKCILLHFIHSELAYHAKCLEELTKLYGEINFCEPKGELCEFVKKYNIMKNMNEEQLSHRYNFTPGVTERKKLNNQNSLDGKKNDKKTAQKNKLNEEES